MLTAVMDKTPKRLNVRSTAGEIEAFSEAAKKDHADLSTWIRQLCWARIQGQKRPKARAKPRG